MPRELARARKHEKAAAGFGDGYAASKKELEVADNKEEVRGTRSIETYSKRYKVLRTFLNTLEALEPVVLRFPLQPPGIRTALSVER